MGLIRTLIVGVAAASVLVAGAVAQPLASGAPAGVAGSAAILPLPAGHSAGLLLAQQAVGGGFLGAGVGGLMSGIAAAVAVGNGQAATAVVASTGTSA